MEEDLQVTEITGIGCFLLEIIEKKAFLTVLPTKNHGNQSKLTESIANLSEMS